MFVVYCEVIARNKICWMLVMNECKCMSTNVNSVNNNLLQTMESISSHLKHFKT